MVKLRKGAKAEIAVVILTIAAVSGILVATQPGNPSVNVEVLPKGGLLQNITVSCYQCVPFNKDKWEGKLYVAGSTADVDYYGSASSVAITLGAGVEYPLNGGIGCSGYFTNSSCILPLKGPLPWDVGFDIQKTSTGGYLKVAVYYGAGKSLVFNATSGKVVQNVVFESV